MSVVVEYVVLFTYRHYSKDNQTPSMPGESSTRRTSPSIML